MTERTSQAESLQATIRHLARCVLGKRNPIEGPPGEPFEVRKRRELLADLQLYDAALDSITKDLGEERTKCGLAFYQEMPAARKSPRMLALQAGLIQLSRWHSETLREYAA